MKWHVIHYCICVIWNSERKGLILLNGLNWLKYYLSCFFFAWSCPTFANTHTFFLQWNVKTNFSKLFDMLILNRSILADLCSLIIVLAWDIRGLQEICLASWGGVFAWKSLKNPWQSSRTRLSINIQTHKRQIRRRFNQLGFLLLQRARVGWRAATPLARRGKE